MTDERPFMVGLPCEKTTRPIRGSKRRGCARCRRSVWISPASIEIVRAERCVVICLPCAWRAFPGGRDADAQPLTEDQMKEFRESTEGDA